MDYGKYCDMTLAALYCCPQYTPSRKKKCEMLVTHECSTTHYVLVLSLLVVQKESNKSNWECESKEPNLNSYKSMNWVTKHQKWTSRAIDIWMVMVPKWLPNGYELGGDLTGVLLYRAQKLFE
jgi:hypothetical protein